MSTQVIHHTAKPSDYTERKKLVLVKTPGTTVDEFLVNQVFPELRKQQKRKDAKEISQLAFCYRLVNGTYKALLLWRELPNATSEIRF